MNRAILISIAAALIIVGIAGCASTTGNLQRATALYLVNVNPESVVVSNVVKSAFEVKWEADTPKGSYACIADDMVRRVDCIQK